MITSNSNRWGLVLAGGEGTRLKSFTKRIAGYELPKQFCPVLSSKPLLRETLDRAARLISPNRTLISVNRKHRGYYSPMLHGAPQLLIEEPLNRGTAPAILHALVRLWDLAPSAIVGLFPSDHYIGDEARFASYADSAFDIAADSNAVILLGAEAKGPEQSYGWIEPETSLTSAEQRLFSVRRFVEKPSARLANELWRGGALWNTLVLVARLSTLLEMFIRATPRLYRSFGNTRALLGTVLEAEVLTRLYHELPTSGFSEVILQQNAAKLMVMPLRGVEWCDLGQPGRVMQVVRQMGVPPPWAVA